MAASVLLTVCVFCGCAEKKPPASDKSAATEKRPQAPPAEADAFTPEAGFSRLTLDDFEAFYGKKPGATATWTADGGTIHSTGKPRGYLHSKKSYKNFTLRLDYRFEPPQDQADAEKANTGVLVYINAPHRLWPLCLEVQGKYSEMGHIKANGRADAIDAAGVRDDEPARQKSRKPVGEWNSIEIVSRDGALASFLNGTKICDNKPGDLKEGAVGLQAEDFAVEFRRIRIREE
jgi:hypothetical protein